MVKIYAVWFDEGVEYIPLMGVFSSRELAEDYINLQEDCNMMEIEELVLDSES